MYAELHCHSYYSLLDGTSSPAALLQQAQALGYPALALTDHDAVYGAVSFSQAAQEYGIKALLGAELTFTTGQHLTLLVENATGWANLCWLITQARRRAPKGQAALPPELLPDHTAGLMALSGCRQGAIPAAVLRGDLGVARAEAQHYRDLFGTENFWIELQHHLLPEANDLVDTLVQIAQQTGVGYVATNNVHYAAQAQHRLQDVLVSIRHNTTLDGSRALRRPNSEYYLKSPTEMQSRFARYPRAIQNTLLIAERCNFQLHYGLQDLPRFPTPAGMSALAMLWQLCETRLSELDASMPIRMVNQLTQELTIIEQAGLANYFLIVWDIVRFAREHTILCQGRGSAANSLVAYLLGISPVDPIQHDLVFERFLSAERQIAPDIDIDFQADRREEVIQYIYECYGTTHAAMACTFVTFRARSAIRDVGKVLDLPTDLVDIVAKKTDIRSGSQIAEQLQEMVGNAVLPWELLLDLCDQIDGLPRHLGIHNGGMVITGQPLASRLPTEPASMTDRVVVQWDKEGMEDSGLIKIDILGLRMLSAIAEALSLIESDTGTRPDLSRCTYDDPAVFAMIARADTVGVFQVESRAQAQMLPRFKPTCFADLIVAISLIRPGPIQGNMVHPYLRRRLGEEPVTYLHPRLESALQETLGVILFQEQVLKVARDLAGFTPGQGEQLRRALGKKNATAALEEFRTAFLHGAEQQGVDRAIAEQVFAALRGFGSYSFPKSHAAAFAVLVYQSAWLKHYYPHAFYAALLNNQPMGFWSPAVIVHEAKHHGIAFLPVHINLSQGKCTLEAGAIRLGFCYVRGMGDANITELVAARDSGFADFADFCQRVELPRRLVENLIMAGAMDDWQPERRHLIWELKKHYEQANALGLIFAEDEVDLPTISQTEMLGIEYDLLGVSLHQHPMSPYRSWCETQDIVSSQQLSRMQHEQHIVVAGLNVVHQAPPTAKGHHFITLEDEYGMINVIVRPQVYASYRQIIRETSLLKIVGILQRQGDVMSILAGKIARLPQLTDL